MKGLSGLLFIVGIGVAANAIDGKWAFDRTQSGGSWVALDLLVAVALFLASMLVWNWAKRRELTRLIRAHRSVGESQPHVDSNR